MNLDAHGSSSLVTNLWMCISRLLPTASSGHALPISCESTSPGFKHLRYEFPITRLPKRLFLQLVKVNLPRSWNGWRYISSLRRILPNHLMLSLNSPLSQMLSIHAPDWDTSPGLTIPLPVHTAPHFKGLTSLTIDAIPSNKVNVDSILDILDSRPGCPKILPDLNRVLSQCRISSLQTSVYPDAGLTFSVSSMLPFWLMCALMDGGTRSSFRNGWTHTHQTHLQSSSSLIHTLNLNLPTLSYAPRRCTNQSTTTSGSWAISPFLGWRCYANVCGWYHGQHSTIGCW